MLYKRYKKGDRPSASEENRKTEAIESLMQMNVGGGLSYSRTGKSVSMRSQLPQRLALFVLTEEIQWPDHTRTEGSADEPDVPWAPNCAFLLASPHTYLYGASYEEGPQTVYFPICPLNNNGIAIGKVSDFYIGSRFLSRFSQQSGRWECMEPIVTMCRGVYRADGTIDLSDWVLGDVGVNIVAGSAPSAYGQTFNDGTEVLLWWCRALNQFLVLGAECP